MRPERWPRRRTPALTLPRVCDAAAADRRGRDAGRFDLAGWDFAAADLGALDMAAADIGTLEAAGAGPRLSDPRGAGADLASRQLALCSFPRRAGSEAALMPPSIACRNWFVIKTKVRIGRSMIGATMVIIATVP